LRQIVLDNRLPNNQAGGKSFWLSSHAIYGWGLECVMAALVCGGSQEAAFANHRVTSGLGI